jgi:hypothetical protein
MRQLLNALRDASLARSTQFLKGSALVHWLLRMAIMRFLISWTESDSALTVLWDIVSPIPKEFLNSQVLDFFFMRS